MISDELFDEETKFMKNLNHPRVCKFVDAQKITSSCCIIVIEYPSKGKILDYFLYANEISDKILRVMFHHILKGRPNYKFKDSNI